MGKPVGGEQQDAAAQPSCLNEKGLAFLVGADTEYGRLAMLLDHTFPQTGSGNKTRALLSADDTFPYKRLDALHGWLLGKGLLDAFFEAGEGCGVAGGPKIRCVSLRVVLVTVFQITGKWDVFNFSGTVNLHEGLSDGLEGASLTCTGIDDGVGRLSGAIGQESGEEHVDVREVFDEDEVATLFAVGIAA